MLEKVEVDYMIYWWFHDFMISIYFTMPKIPPNWKFASWVKTQVDTSKSLDIDFSLKSWRKRVCGLLTYLLGSYYGVHATIVVEEDGASWASLLMRQQNKEMKEKGEERHAPKKDT